MIKVTRPEIFQQLLLKTITYTELCTKIRVSENFMEQQPRSFQWMIKWVKFSLLSEQEYAEIGNDQDDDFEFRGLPNGLWEYNVERTRIIPIFIQKLSMFVVR